jgi:hypothetical protein
MSIPISEFVDLCSVVGQQLTQCGHDLCTLRNLASPYCTPPNPYTRPPFLPPSSAKSISGGPVSLLVS